MSRKNALIELESLLEQRISDYERDKWQFQNAEKFDIDHIFSVWDKYIDFVNKNWDLNQKEIEKRKSESVRGGEFVSDYDRLFLLKDKSGDATLDLAEEFNESMNIIMKKVYYNNPLENKISNLLMDELGDLSLYKFFIHDINHLHGDMNEKFWNISHSLFIPTIKKMSEHREHVIKDLETFNNNPEYFYGLRIEPYKMLLFSVKEELGRNQIFEDVDLKDLSLRAASVLSDRYAQLAYFVTEESLGPNFNELIIDVDDIKVKGNSGVSFSIIYNLMKNSYKKFEGKAFSGFKIFNQIYKSSDSTYVMNIGDNGTPIDLNLMKEKIRTKILKEGLNSIPFTNNKQRNKFAAWQNSEYQVGNLKLKDISDIAFMYRMSGYDNKDSFSSGLGLYGLKSFVQRFGGRILYGEDFQNGGPVFSCILPTDPSNNVIGNAFNNLRTLNITNKHYSNGRMKKVVGF